jgi:hypothetical protein
VASIVIAEEEADEAGVSLVRGQAVAHELVVAEPAAHVEAEHG